MKVREFADLQRQYLRTSWFYLAALALLFFGELGLGLLIDRSLREVWISVFGLLVLAFLVILFFHDRRYKRRGLTCKSCGRSLLGLPGRLAIASGKCWSCGGAAFDA